MAVKPRGAPGSSPPNGNDKKLIDRPRSKFIIGFAAGITTALSPLLIPAVSQGDISAFENILLTGKEIRALKIFILLGVGLSWSMLVGLVVMYIEWWEPRKPGETFFKALGIPALLAGAIATTSQTLETKNLERLKQREIQQQQAIIQSKNLEVLEKSRELREALDIPEKSIPVPKEVFENVFKSSFYSPPREITQTPPGTASTGLALIGVAHAQQPGAGPLTDQAKADQAQREAEALKKAEIAFQAAEQARKAAREAEAAAQRAASGGRKSPTTKYAPQPKSLYAVSLLNTKSRTIADQFSEQWVTKIPTLKTVKINEVYFVFTGTKPLAEQEAIEIAVRLKKQGHKPELIRLK